MIFFSAWSVTAISSPQQRRHNRPRVRQIVGKDAPPRGRVTFTPQSAWELRGNGTLTGLIQRIVVLPETQVTLHIPET